jgi:lincosamide nucleotidyltransferase A/C/D/E
MPEKSMSSHDAVDLYVALENLGVKIWIDGGWSVDALLGIQTRPHRDLDIAIEYKHLSKLREHLESQGYKDVERDKDSKWNFVLGDDNGREVDVHAFTFDENGRVLEGIEFPDGSLAGIGTIDGHAVRCISPEFLVKFHSGYELKEKDFQDVAALCEKFGIEYPEEYAHLRK